MKRANKFIAVGRAVEDRRDDRPDVCLVSYDQHGASRSYSEACALAAQIAEALNKVFPDANSGKPE